MDELSRPAAAVSQRVTFPERESRRRLAGGETVSHVRRLHLQRETFRMSGKLFPATLHEIIETGEGIKTDANAVWLVTDQVRVKPGSQDQRPALAV